VHLQTPDVAGKQGSIPGRARVRTLLTGLEQAAQASRTAPLSLQAAAAAAAAAATLHVSYN
jgi:hypothetical protein